MSYDIRLTDSDFRIPAGKTAAALDAIRDLMTDPTANRSGYSHSDGDQFAYVRATPDNWNHLDDAMAAWRFPITYDDEGNVTDLEFHGEKLGDERELFKRLTPFVESGSYLEFTGADGDRFRYVYTDDGFEHRTDDEFTAPTDQ